RMKARATEADFRKGRLARVPRTISTWGQISLGLNPEGKNLKNRSRDTISQDKIIIIKYRSQGSYRRRAIPMGFCHKINGKLATKIPTAGIGIPVKKRVCS